MPKKLLEIKSFTDGIISTPSSTDTGEQSAKYSCNIDAHTADGRLQGIDGDKILTVGGFKSNSDNSSEYQISTNFTFANQSSVADYAREMIAVSDKKDSSRINLVIGKSQLSGTNVVNTVSIIENVLSDYIVENNLGNVGQFDGNHSFVASDDKVFIGLGGNESSPSKVVMRPSKKSISGTANDSIGLFDAALTPPGMDDFSGMFSEFLVFPIHGTNSNLTEALSVDDTGTANTTDATTGFYADYDVILDNTTNAMTLYEALQSGASGSTIAGLKVGQVFKQHDTGDFADGAMVGWKQYDYDASVTAVAAGDLFMFCGYIDGTSNVPILRYLGTASDVGGTAAFAYAIKEDNSKLYKISLTSTADATAFDGAVVDSSYRPHDSTGENSSIKNVGKRITSIDLSDLEEFPASSISAFSECHSPPLYNTINLEGAGDSNVHVRDVSPFYHNNGHLKMLYRHGVFYIASSNESEKLYRLNAIDFHKLTNDEIAIEDITLSFSKIPSTLVAENGDGIVRRTIEDQLLEPDCDPKEHTWTNNPVEAEIIGICETFDSGKLLSEVKDSNFSSHEAYRFVTVNNSRLTSGDKVRFAGMNLSTPAAAEENFNVYNPYEVSVVADGKAFYVDSGSADRVANLQNTDANANTNRNIWWNAKVWILYGKKTSDTAFHKWDLFLYNANTLDMESDRTVYMADRTPPYHQARYYMTDEAGSTNDQNKLWYPGEFAFVKRDGTPGLTSTTDNKLQNDDLRIPRGSIAGSGTSGNYCEFGIYDKSGRWACNGVQRVAEDTSGHAWYTGHWNIIPEHCYSERPIDWVGGEDGPRAWNGCHQAGHSNTKEAPGNAGNYGGTVDTENVRGISGHLLWGQNIGWSIDNERQVIPTKNSLHPSVPYSTLYNGNLIYTGFNDIFDGVSGSYNYQNTFPDKTSSSNSINKRQANFRGLSMGNVNFNHNRPKHAVTFMGKVTGDFVVQPRLIGRKGVEWHLGHNTTGDMSRAFEVDNLTYERIQSYSGEYTLFSIDDFSGHRGSVKYAEGNDAVGLSNHYNTDGDRLNKGGLEVGRPNWGGPEIEPPTYRGTHFTQNWGDFGTDHESGSHPSVNGGFVDISDENTNNTGNDKGWDGYTPPSIFNPGSGYYVYINRTWKNQCDNTEGAAAEGQFKRTKVWGFQTEGLELVKSSEQSATNKGVWSQRWHNFSSTAIADAFYYDYRAGREDRNKIITNDEARGYTRFYSPGAWDTHNEISTIDDSPGRYGRTFSRTNVSPATEVCTMHKIQIDNIGEIKSIFPVIFQSEVERDAHTDGYILDHHDFFTGYLCALDRSSEGTKQTSALVIRTNFDFMHSMRGGAGLGVHSVTGTTAEDDFSNSVWFCTPYNHYGGYTDNLSPNQPIQIPNQGTHNAEIFSIGTDSTSIGDELDPDGTGGQGTDIEKLKFKQAAIDDYESSITGDSLVLMRPNPWEKFAINATLGDSNVHWIFQVNSSTNGKLYLAKNDDSLRRTTSAVYPEDFDCTFFSDDSGQLLSAADDSEILTELIGLITFTDSAEGDTGTLEAGKYYYKIAYEYDDIYESTLSEGYATNILTNDPVGTDNTWEYVKVKISIPSGMVNGMPRRVTGIVIYRKYEGNEADEYSRLKLIKLNDKWLYNSTTDTYQKEIYDRDKLDGTYSAWNGIDESLENTSLNYGLSTAFRGYLFVSKAWHPDLEDVKRYVFRSQPDNFFAFDWTTDFVILPEIPIAMASFNGRIYAWGKNNLYKIDPFSLLIEDTFEGFSILNSNSFVVTEFGLFFMDSNNVYLHDGNQPSPIADPILYSSNDSVVYNITGTDGYIKLEQGYRDLAASAISNNHNPSIVFAARKNSILVCLSNSAEEGKVFAYNITRRRWDLWDSPKPYAIAPSKDSDIFISDGQYVYNYLKDESSEWEDYRRRKGGIAYGWDWFSKDINFGADTQDKVFRNIKFSGTPIICDFSVATGLSEDTESVEIYNSLASPKTSSIEAYVDNTKIESLSVSNKFYETVNLGGTHLIGNINSASNYLTIKTDIKPYTNSGATDVQTNSKQQFIRPGHLIKVGNEIMLVETATLDTTTLAFHYTLLKVTRGVMGTTAAAHSGTISSGASVEIVSPTLKFPAGTKGKNLSIRLAGQKGYIDSIGVVYKPKSIK